MLNLFQHLIPLFCFTFNFVEGFAVLWLAPFEDSIVETLRATSRNISDVVGAYNVLWISAI